MKSEAVHLFMLRWPIKWFVWVLREVPQIKYLPKKCRRSGFPCVSWGVAGMVQESLLLLVLVLAEGPEFKMARQEDSVQDLGQTSRAQTAKSVRGFSSKPSIKPQTQDGGTPKA